MNTLSITWPLKTWGGVCAGNVQGEVDTEVEEVGCQVGEIGRGQGILAPRCQYRAYTLSIAWPSKICGGGCRGSVWVGVNMCVDVVGCWDKEIAWG